MTRIAVYTVITGGYDVLRRPKFVDSNCDYYCITDNTSLTSDFWQIIYVQNNEKIDNTRFARYIKISPHKFFPNYDASLYIDSNIELRGSVNEFIKENSSGKPMICLLHSQRDCIYDEAAECIRLGKDEAERIESQMQRFRDDHYPAHYGLTQNSVLYREHNNKSVIQVMEDWWSIVKTGSRRDQLSFCYVCWKNRFIYDTSTEDWQYGKYFRRYPHIPEAYVYPEGHRSKAIFVPQHGSPSVCEYSEAPLINRLQNYSLHNKDIPLPLVYRFEDNFHCPANTKKVCFEPFCGQFCVVGDLHVYMGQTELPAHPLNGYSADRFLYFPTTTPQIQIDLKQSTAGVINISADIYIILHGEDWDLISAALRMKRGPLIRKLADRMKNVPGASLLIKGLRALKHKGVAYTLAKVRNKFLPRKYSYSSSGVRIQERAPIKAHTESVDIIICIHNAYDDVKRCMESVFKFTSEPYQIILVDDGSQEQTRDYLIDLENRRPNIKRIRNEAARGYCYAANMGMRASSAQYIVLLNSDTIVSDGWMDKLISCASSSPEIGVVGPLSNTASWQSVPLVSDQSGDWCHNPLPAGCSPETFAALVNKASARIYPQVPLLNGFCMLITRKTIDAIGCFDEETFGPGFGEEDDFNLRAGKAGIKLAIADDTYVYHAQSKSYTDARRIELCKSAGEKLLAKHGDELLGMSVHIAKDNFIMEGIRARLTYAFECSTLVAAKRKKYEGLRLLIILPISEAGGGGNVIIQEARAMRIMGVDVRLYNLIKNKSVFEAAYPALEIPVLYGKNLEGFVEYAKDFDAICNTLYSSVKFCASGLLPSKLKVAYYIQDFEPYFFEVGSSDYYEAYRSYTAVENIIRVTKTSWNACEVEKECNVPCHVVGPSVNLSLFRPRKMFLNSECVHICAMIRPSSPRRAPEQTMQVFDYIKKRFGKKVEIEVFGGSNDELATLEAPKNFKFVNLGFLQPEQLAVVLNRNDLFVDFSTFQAMGLTALEAMACGCAVIVPSNGGTNSYAINERNCLVADTGSMDQCCQALARLIEDEALRNRLAYRAISDACAFYPEKCAAAFLDHVFGDFC